METLFIYIAKSSGLLIVFYFAYYFLLRKETFFTSNRWFLLAGLGTSLALPFWVYTKTIWVDSEASLNINLQQTYIPQPIAKESFEINWFYLTLAVYSIVLLGLLIKFAMDFYKLNSVLKGQKIKQQADFKFVDVNENIAPFSYFDYIVYNSSLYTADELENIIEHEKVHSDQNHTVDVLISRIFCMLFWFNPVVWLYKKAISQNLEFIADREAAKKLSDKKAYQYTLLKITTHENCVAITNHFYQSLIKKRIIMLNKNQSKKRNSWKYYTVIPALIAFVLLFQVEVIAHEKKVAEKGVTSEKMKSMDVFKILKSTTDQELKQIAETLKLNHNVDLVVSDVKRNSENELTAIKLDIKNGTTQSKAMQVEGSTAIKGCSILVSTEEDGTKKISLVTDDNSENTEEKIVKIRKIQKTTTDAKINDTNNTSTTTNTATNTTVNGTSNTTVKSNVNTNISINTNVNGDEVTTVIANNEAKPKVIIRSNKKNTGKQLIIVDGVVLPNYTTTDDLESLDIESMNVLKGANAIAKYGDEGKNGVIEIITRK
ncbi:M56 family metallopeptidase [Flavobacterium sp. MC2016-06]|uniref:M56 family metallopeptidase n=1 Tax=Flavobacterium sp. MC2016-06 TaxID=2676308 RepID=UPI0012BADCAB|nr:M56 family metallopeptidase [Flavobacterium sp. MC2016-06]MBU3862464.1 M56 family peptidase [Flavobacterium sp. MC2016-06]